MRNVSDKTCIENENLHFMSNNLVSEKSAVNEIMLKKCCTAGQATDVNIKRRMCIGSWTPRATHTHTHTHTQSM